MTKSLRETHFAIPFALFIFNWTLVNLLVLEYQTGLQDITNEMNSHL